MTDAPVEELVADAIPLPKAPKHIPGRPDKSTVFRWYSIGVRGHKLETFLVGGRRMTSKAMIADFLRRLNEDDTGAGVPSDPKKPKTKSSGVGKALEAMGC